MVVLLQVLQDGVMAGMDEYAVGSQKHGIQSVFSFLVFSFVNCAMFCCRSCCKI